MNEISWNKAKNDPRRLTAVDGWRHIRLSQRTNGNAGGWINSNVRKKKRKENKQTNKKNACQFTGFRMYKNYIFFLSLERGTLSWNTKEGGYQSAEVRRRRRKLRDQCGTCGTSKKWLIFCNWCYPTTLSNLLSIEIIITNINIHLDVFFLGFAV